MEVRRACKNWLFAHPPPLVESASDWRDQTMPFGFSDMKIRKQGNEHSLCGLSVRSQFVLIYRSHSPITDLTLAVGSSSRVADSVSTVQTPSTPLEASQDPQPIIEDIFANIQHVQGDFVHRLIQNGALNYKSDTIWKPRDCRILRTSPNEDSYKEFTKCLTLILTVAKLWGTPPRAFPSTQLGREHPGVRRNSF